MADEIKQTFTIDAAQSLQALRDLNAEFQSLSKTLDTVATSMGGFNRKSGVERAAKVMGTSVKETTAQVERLTVSWGLLSRVVTTQAIVSEFRRFRAVTAQAVTDAIQFQTQLAQIGTISDGQLGSLEQIGDSVRGISDAYNLGLSDTASGLYETLSAQIGEGAESLEFLKSAAEFASGSVTTLDSSVSLLAGTLNAFGKSAGDADDVASKFFKVIDLGNTTSEQLGTSFNRVSARAKEAGLAFEEQAAFFALATQRGVQTSEAATLLSGILSGLIKPTTSMTESLRKLGFSSAQTALQTEGLGGLLVALKGTTDGSAESLAKLFPNIRGLSGALQVVSDDAAGFNSVLQEIKGTSEDLAKTKALEILATDGQKVSAEFNKLKNSLTTGLGESVLRIGANLVDLGINARNTTAVIEAFGPVLATGTAALGLYAAAALKGATANAAFMNSFKGGTVGLLLGAGAAAGGSFLGDQLIKAIEGPQKRFDEVAKQAIEKLKANARETLRQQAEADRARVQAAQGTVADLNKLYLEDVANAERSGKLLGRTAERIADDIVSGRERIVDAIRDSVRDSRQSITESQGRVGDLGAQLDDRAFDRTTKALTDAQQVFALSQRSEQLARQAAAEFAKGDEDRGQNLFARAQAAGREAEAIAERTGARELEARAARAVDDALRQQLTAEKSLQLAEQNRSAAAEKLSNRQIELLDQAREQVDIIRKNSNVFDSTGKLLDPEQLAKQRKAIEDTLGNFKGFSAKELVEFDKAGLGDVARDFNLELSKNKLQLSFSVTEEIGRIQSQLAQSFDQFKVNLGFDVGNLEQILGTTFQNPDQVAQGLQQVADKTAEVRQRFADLKASEAEALRLKTGVLGIAAAADETSRNLLRLAGVNTQAVGDSAALVDTIQQQLSTMAQSASITDEQLRSVFQNIAALREQALSGDVAKNVGLALDVNEFSRAVGLLTQLKTVRDGLVTSDPTASFQSSTVAIQNGAMAAEQLASAYQRAAAAAQQLSVQQPVGKMHGGMMHLADGGYARGVDTIPAMLSPGEFVVNPKSTQRFYSQLQAINAGQTPVFRQDGGTVNNTTVGDIIVNGAKSPQATGQEIARMLNRSIRRGTGRVR